MHHSGRSLYAICINICYALIPNIDLFLPIISFSNSYSQILIFKKKEKKDFIESMENIAELFVEFSVEKIVEKLRDKDPCLTPRSHPQCY